MNLFHRQDLPSNTKPQKVIFQIGILEEVKTWPDLKSLRLMFTAPNPEVERLIQHFEFKQFGHEVNGIYVDGQYHDRIYYQKQL